ncbi:MAG: hypothetical protein K2X87_19900 [Gemmataceae bacterium]|nr:hypothetical protein [Gemmataceae bacterium]
MTLTGPVTAVVSEIFNAWCVDIDRNIGGAEYTAEFFSSYAPGTFPDTTTDPKTGGAAVEATGFVPANTSRTPATTNAAADTVTFSPSSGCVTGQEVAVTTASGGLAAGTYFVRVSGSSVSFYNTAAQASAGGTTGRANLTGPVTSAIYRTQSIDFTATHNLATGTRVRVSIATAGLAAGTDYYVRSIGPKTVSFYPTAADAAADTNRITLAAPGFDPTARVRVAENLVEKPENLDLVNWVLNQNFVGQPAGDSTNYTYGDVQKAIWQLLGLGGPLDTTNAGVGPYTVAHVTAIVAAAQANGNGFVPGPGDVVGVILDPVGNEQITLAAVPYTGHVGEICNTAVVSTDETGPVPSDEACVEVEQEPDFEVVKSGGPRDEAVDEAGDVIDYTIAVSNTGNVGVPYVTA